MCIRAARPAGTWSTLAAEAGTRHSRFRGNSGPDVLHCQGDAVDGVAHFTIACERSLHRHVSNREREKIFFPTLTGPCFDDEKKTLYLPLV